MWTEFAWRLAVDQRPALLEMGWRYETGLMMLALDKASRHLGSAEMLESVDRWLDRMVHSDGTIAGYRAEDYNLDNINPGKLLWPRTNGPQGEKYRLAVERLMEQMRHQPRTQSGGFWHKQIYPQQMWLDGIYMAMPFVLVYGQNYHQFDWVDEAVNQVTLLYSHTRDPKSGLLYHGWDEARQQAWAHPDTGCSSQFWGRSVGWFIMALVDLLESIPKSYPGWVVLSGLLSQLATAVVRVQDPESGLWWQVLDRPHAPGNYREASVSAMVVYALAKGMRLGLLAANFYEPAVNAYRGIERRLCRRDGEGIVHLSQCNAVSGLGGSPYRDGSYTYYVTSPVVEDEIKAVAALILAGIEMEQQKAANTGGS